MNPALVEDDWDASMYDRVMGAQQLSAAAPLLDALSDPDEGLVIEAGCGSGLVVAALLQRFVRARVLAIDISPHMLDLTRARLAQHPRIEYCLADLQDFVRPQSARSIFSNATLHWVPDHHRLFAQLYATLQPAGFLASQFAYCGPTNQQLLGRLCRLRDSRAFKAHWRGPPPRLGPIVPAREHAALTAAGFVDIHIEEVAFDFYFADIAEQHVFTRDVILRDQTRCLPSPRLRDALVEQFLGWNDALVGPLRQRYESLRCLARRPAGGTG